MFAINIVFSSNPQKNLMKFSRSKLKGIVLLMVLSVQAIVVTCISYIPACIHLQKLILINFVKIELIKYAKENIFFFLENKIRSSKYFFSKDSDEINLCSCIKKNNNNFYKNIYNKSFKKKSMLDIFYSACEKKHVSYSAINKIHNPYNNLKNNAVETASYGGFYNFIENEIIALTKEKVIYKVSYLGKNLSLEVYKIDVQFLTNNLSVSKLVFV